MIAANKIVKSAAARKPPAAGKGRVKGVPNKLTKELKAMILGALDDAGGQEYLRRQAEANPSTFLALIGKVLPLTIAGPGPRGEHSFTLTKEQCDAADAAYERTIREEIRQEMGL